MHNLNSSIPQENIIHTVFTAFKDTAQSIGKSTKDITSIKAQSSFVLLEEFINDLLNKNQISGIKIEHSVGKGRFATIPWLSLRSKKFSNSPQEGFYIVLLMSKDRSALFLTLIHGFTYFTNRFENTKDALDNIRQITTALRNQLSLPKDTYLEHIELMPNEKLKEQVEGYESGCIFAKRYNYNSPPTNNEFSTDVLDFIQQYSKLETLFSGKNFEEYYNSVLQLPKSKIQEQEPTQSTNPQSFFDTQKQNYFQPQITTYNTLSIIKEGCFLSEQILAELLITLKTKKNIILQGAPGTGKTWLAKKLGYATIGKKDSTNIKAVQFHPNLAYEDFIRGWRPTGDGKLELLDGPFMEMVKLAKSNPSEKYVIVIEEINRGNPAQIFGEMLTLLEADKRCAEEALELSYTAKTGMDNTVYIPQNLYVIGTMNIADRSLALVDFALRRRFAFITLKPNFEDSWKRWMLQTHNIPKNILEIIQSRIIQLNKIIENDKNLGEQFCIGHSYLTPSKGIQITDWANWFYRVAEYEILPLLEEYWYDPIDKLTIQNAKKMLMENF